ncbi:MAG: hypothetical protein KHZ62_03750 [Clostridiales bacterium]|nr:hypothetical protein [Clostridiales bacterium]
MYTYNLHQWFSFFYIYSFLGWCFESAYVSFDNRKLVNRGFMKGPFLPLYGAGAISVLFVALPVKNMPFFVFLLGSLTATILEYFTGMAMEAIFKVKYWDYSDKKWNYKGRICLFSSIAWGFLSLFLIYLIHKPIESFLLSVNDTVIELISFLMTALLAGDFVSSFRTAIDMRDLLIQLEEQVHNAQEEFRLLQKRLDVLQAVRKDEIAERRRILEEAFHKKLKVLAESEAIQERIDSLEKFLRSLEQSDAVKAIQDEISEWKVKHKVFLEESGQKFTKDKIKMLRRNPTATSKKYIEEFQWIKNKIKDNKK